MAKIIGNPTVTPMAVPDWNQTDATKADFIKNKPMILTEEEIIELIGEHGGGGTTGKVVQSIAYYDTTTDGQIGIYVWYTDGTEETIWIPASSGGGDGVGIDRIEPVYFTNEGYTEVTIYLTDGTSSDFTISDGKTPQKGVDYWTDADKSEIKDYIDGEVGNINSVLEEIIELQNGILGIEPEEITYYFLDGDNESIAIKGVKGMTWGEAFESKEFQETKNSQGVTWSSDGYLRMWASFYMYDKNYQGELTKDTISSWGIKADDVVQDGHYYGASYISSSN